MNAPQSVALTACPDYGRERIDPALDVLLDPLGGMVRFVSPGDRVLLKPNLLKGAPPEACVTTHPAVVEGMIRRVLDCGGRSFVGDSPAFGGLADVAERAGIAAVCRKYDVPLVPFVDPVSVKVSDPWIREIMVDRAALEADRIINLPKLKAHCQTGMTAAVKNLFGCVGGKRKAWWHFKAGDRDHRFGRMLLQITEVLRPTLHVADAVVAMEGNGPTRGNPRPLGLLAASEDAVALDRVLCEVIAFPPGSVEVFAALREIAPERDLSLEEIKILGTPYDRFVTPSFARPEMEPIRFDLPRIAGSAARHAFRRAVGAVSGWERG